MVIIIKTTSILNFQKLSNFVIDSRFFKFQNFTKILFAKFYFIIYVDYKRNNFIFQYLYVVQ
jgi:hypothetical protein